MAMNDLFVAINAGEWSPKLTCRHDLSKRKAACKSLSNFVVLEHGGVMRRPGATLVSDALEAGNHRLIPFEPELTSGFVFDLSDRKVTVFNFEGQYVTEFETVWGSINLDKIQYVQVNDVMFLVHPNYPPQQILWKGGSAFSIEDLKFSSLPEGSLITDNNLAVTFSGLTIGVKAQKSAFEDGDAGATLTLRRAIGAKTFAANYWDTVNQHATSSSSGPGWKQMIDNVDDGPELVGNLIETGIVPGLVFRMNDVAAGWYRYWTRYGVGRVEGTNPSARPDIFSEGILMGDSSGKCMFTVNGGWRVQVEGSAPYGQYRVYVGALSAVSVGDLNRYTMAPHLATGFVLVADETSSPENTRQLDIQGTTDEPSYLVVVLVRRRSGGAGSRTVTQNAFEARYSGVITSVTSDTEASLTLTEASTDVLTNYTCTAWSMSAMRDLDGNPSCIAFYQNRLWLGGIANEPQTVYASHIDDYTNFAIGDEDDAALSLTILSRSRDKVLWMCADDGILVGTESSEWRISSGDGKVITPSSYEVRRMSGVGSAAILPVTTPDGLVFTGAGRRRIYEYTYNYSVDRYQANDLAILAEHIVEAPIIDVVFQRMKTPVLWCLANNGDLVGCTYNRQQEVVAWHRHKFGTEWKVKAIAILHDPVGGMASGYDQLFMIVQVDGDNRLARMQFNPDYATWSDSGSVYESRLVLMPMEIVARDGTNTLGQRKRIGQAWIKLEDGTALRIGTENDSGTDVPFWNTEDGWVQHVLKSPHRRECCLVISHAKAEPCVVLAIRLQWALM